jgi:hypothetical protein
MADNQAMHPSRRSAAILNHSFLAATWVIAAVMSAQPCCISRFDIDGKCRLWVGVYWE